MVQVGNKWDNWLAKETIKPYFIKLEEEVAKLEKKYVLYPKKIDRYRAFATTSREEVKVVILGERPFSKPNRADGLAYSSIADVPRSTENLFRKIEDELGIDCYKDDANLERWAEQGVLLLNKSLTKSAGSLKKGVDQLPWQDFTYAAVNELYLSESPTVFLLFGANWKIFSTMPVSPNHLVFKGYSLDVSDFFFRSYFKETNDFLIKNYGSGIDWR